MNSKDNQDLPLILQRQQDKSWLAFFEQYPQACNALNEQQLHDFKQAITLSDFVLNSALQAPERVISLFQSGNVYDESLPDYASLLAETLLDCNSEDTLHRKLRLFRLVEMVKIAVADLVFNFPLEKSLARLSALADQLILASLKWLSSFCYEKWGTPMNSIGEIQPLLVYGMGKLGGQELNFSSDIDLIFVYPESGETQGVRRTLDNQQFFTRLAQKLIASLHQKTVDGFVYRVDMRLRPFGESGPLVLSFSAAEDYYQEQGRDWERYAMLKARVIGHSSYHEQLVNMLKPFVFRRYIDFSVIDSLRRMKAMIAQEVKRKQLKYNIKLGAGGIREIEFIVQVFQLIRGGQVVELQQKHLLHVLPLLVEHGEIQTENAEVLKRTYCFLRRVENIIQALNDEQTQTLPSNELDQTRLLSALQYTDYSWEQFLTHLQEQMHNVHLQFVELIGEASPNNQALDENWLTLWDSQWSDEESVTWVKGVNEACDAEFVWCTLRDFRQSLSNKRIGQRGRQVLDKLIPAILGHLNQLKTEDIVLTRILSVTNKIITRTAYLELLFENEGALLQLIKLCRSSSWLTDHIAQYPILLDELIDPKLLNNPPALNSYKHDLRQSMLRVPEDDLEAQMNKLRQFKQVQQLRIAAADISDVLDITKVSDHLTAVAEAIIEEVINLAWQQISVRTGIPTSLEGKSHKGFAVIGYGKMGGIELGYSSDLDLVFLHQSSSNEITNGEKSVSAVQFYMKLAQRIMHIFNARMSSGLLYELDMRLRPSGNSGLMVVHLDTFLNYQKEEAWTWEHQALVRTRVIYGHDEFVNQFNEVKKSILTQHREPAGLLQDVVDMRKKMRDHLDKSTHEYRDIKQGEGGLVDIEFLAQYLILKSSEEYPAVSQYSDNIRIFEQLALLKIITIEQQVLLTHTYCQLRHLGHRATLTDQPPLIPINEFNAIAKSNSELCSALMKA